MSSRKRQPFRCGWRRRPKDALHPESFRPRTTECRRGLGDNANLLVDRQAAAEINEARVVGFTDVPPGTRTSRERFGHLAPFMDLLFLGIGGWKHGSSLDEELVPGALRERDPKASPEVRTEAPQRPGRPVRGPARALLRRSGMRQGTSAAANCYDYASSESYAGTVKTGPELVDYANDFEATREPTGYVHNDIVERRRSAPGDWSPAEFERQLTARKMRLWTVHAN